MSGYGVYVIELKTRRVKASLCSLSWVRAGSRPRSADASTTTVIAPVRPRCSRTRGGHVPSCWWICLGSRIARPRSSLSAGARRLGDAGFDVQCDGLRMFSPPPTWRPFSEAELVSVEDCFKAQLRGLLGSALRALTVEEAVGLLRWRHHDPSVAELVATPNDHLGRFAHADEAAVRARVIACRSISPRLIGT